MKFSRGMILCGGWFLTCLIGCAGQDRAAEALPKTWWVKDLAMFSNPRVTVTDEDEQPLGRLSTRALRNLSRAKIGITEASGLYSELIIVEGEEANAFAGFFEFGVPGIPAGTPAIVLSLGLVELLGRDTDAAAYLIGHETGHLLKGHAVDGTRNMVLRRIRVLTEAGANNNSSRPATDAIPFTLSRPGAPYTEAQEQEAHEAGMRYATAAGYDGAGAERLGRILGEATVPGSSPLWNRHLSDFDALR